MLSTIYQKTCHSSSETESSAQILALDIGANYQSWSIDNLIEQYVKLGNQSIMPESLNWQQHDIALQNIQARARAPGIWLIANLKNQLLIATSNLSEASVGYCTMDGDTAGVLAPIGGLSKSWVLRLNSYLFEQGFQVDDECIEILGLKAVTNLRPSAELRPTEQSDEQDLMPYEVLDSIRTLAQVKNLMPNQIMDYLINREKFSGNYSQIQLTNWVEKYFLLYTRNQWKRERLATSLHLLEDSACPKTYRRYPVLSKSS